MHFETGSDPVLNTANKVVAHGYASMGCLELRNRMRRGSETTRWNGAGGFLQSPHKSPLAFHWHIRHFYIRPFTQQCEPTFSTTFRAFSSKLLVRKCCSLVHFVRHCSGDQRKPHDSGENVDLDRLKELGVLYWQIPQEEGWEGEIGKFCLCP